MCEGYLIVVDHPEDLPALVTWALFVESAPHRLAVAAHLKNDIMTLGHYDTMTLGHYDTITLGHYDTRTLLHYDTILGHYDTMTLLH